MAYPIKEKERMPDNERLVLWIGLALVLALSLLIGSIMLGLKYSDSVSRRIPADKDDLVIEPDFPRHLVDFTLTDESGRTVTRKDLEGKIVVVNFILTSCSVVCPYVNAQMEKIQQRTTPQSDVRLISLALDPVDDTVPVLKKYGQTFGQDVNRWSMLTGSETMIRRLVGGSFLDRDTTGQFSLMPGNFANTQRIVLVDQTGHISKYFDGLNQGAGEAVVREIKKLEESSR